MTETAPSVGYETEPTKRISEVRRVELRGDIDAALGLSGAAVVGDYLILGADEGHKLQILERTKDGQGWKLQRDVALAKVDQEVDIEAITYGDGSTREITLKCRIDTAVEIEYIENGGVLHYVLRNLARAA